MFWRTPPVVHPTPAIARPALAKFCPALTGAASTLAMFPPHFLKFHCIFNNFWQGRRAAASGHRSAMTLPDQFGVHC